MKRVADVAVELLTQNGIQHAFMVTGGGAMHLNDAIGRNREIQYIACHHEQACAMAADAYYRTSGRLALVNVTTGPGGTNAITGVFGAWTDSIGMVVLSGQVKWETLVRSTNLPLRQLGDQEVDIVKMVEGITKYAVIIRDPSEIRYEIEKALHLARSGRPGPVWIDIPIDIQAAPVDVTKLRGFTPTSEISAKSSPFPAVSAQEVLSRLQRASRPVIVVGGGIRIAGVHEQFLDLAAKLQIPVATCWNAHDVLWDDHPCYVGRPGSIGTRPGNFAVQNSDCVLILGSRLNVRQVSYNFQSFARHATKIMVDIDAAEIQKPTLKIDLPVHADLRDFIPEMLKADFEPQAEHVNWLSWCKARLKKYPVCLEQYRALENRINPYCFVDDLFDLLDENDQVVTGDGTACVVTFQGAKLKKGQRLFTNSGCASMGFDLPATIGAWYSNKANRIVCIAGDGSLQMNLQELQTLVTHKIPAKIFVLNNEGYHSIRQTQRNFFRDNIIGCGEESGLNFPNLAKISTAYGIPFRQASNHRELRAAIRDCLESPGLQMCEIVLDLEQSFEPKLSSKKLPDGKMVTTPLEDMAPFLDRSELIENTLGPLHEEYVSQR